MIRRTRRCPMVWLAFLLVIGQDALGQGIPRVVDLAGLKDRLAIALGQRSGDQLRVLTAGDFNGDGLTDVVVGTPFFDGPENDRFNGGGAFLILGGSDGVGVRDLGSRGARREDVVFYGAEEDDRFGKVAAHADLDGDGVDDLVIGAPGGDGPGNLRPDAGEVYIFFGGLHVSSEAVRDMSGLLGPGADVTIFGRDTLDGLGASLALGDVDGDGATDLVIGAAGAFGFGNFRAAAGDVYIIFGGPDLRFRSVIDLADPFAGADVVIHGADPVDQAGVTVAVGDLNGDGIDDVALSAPNGDGPGERRRDTGEVYVVFGGRRLASEPIRDLAGVFAPPADLVIYGRFPADGLGLSLGIADVSGDGIEDLVVAARALIRARLGAGEVYVILGSATLPLDGVRDIAGVVGRLPDAVLLGAEARQLADPQPDQFGAALDLADMNDDGIADLVIGAPGADGLENGRLNTGEVYVIPGGLDLFGGLPRDAAGALGPPSEMRIIGPDTGANFGATLVVADIDMDGTKDIIVAAPLDSAGPIGFERRNAGLVFALSAE